jgi:hypothetical protein
MATITATGEIVRIIDGYGFKLVETTKLRSGEEKKTWITVWTKASVRVGDTVTVSGQLSTKLEEYTGRDNVPKTGVAINVNDAEVTSADVPF